jgi:beta-N-acetylhexosaminidase
MPSMMALGAAGDLELAGRAGEQTAFDLRRAGCTLDFAPVLDLALEPGNTVIGTRSLGSDPHAVTHLGEAYARGLERGGILPCFKHFPGHGSTAVDSHLALPVIDAGEETLRKRDLIPFAAVAPHAAAIMGTHAMLRAFDATHPVTLSARIAGDLLRGDLGFGGAFVTDSLEMSALSDYGGTVACAVAALAAGADLLTVSHSVVVAIEIAAAIERAVEDGTLSLERLQEAHARVMRLRESGQTALPVDEFPPHPGVGREIARRAITLIRGMSRVDPVASFAVSFTGEIVGGAEDNRIRYCVSQHRLVHEAPALQGLECSLDPDDAEVEILLSLIEESSRRPLLLARRAHLHPAQARAIARIIERYPDAVVVSMLEPFDLPLFGKARHLLAAYGDDRASIGGLADVLFGGSMPEGRLPVEIALGP